MDRMDASASVCSALSLDLNRMSAKERSSVAERKYAGAIALYASSDLSLRQVAEACGVTARGLSAYIGRHHSPLLYTRYGLGVAIPLAEAIKVKSPKGQSRTTHLKYKEAIEACGDMAYIEYNVSQVARLFDLDGTALASQLRVYYPDLIPNRERLRQRLGVADNIHRGPRPASLEAYSAALDLYRDTDLTVPEVAEKCEVSSGGFCQYMRFYHKDVLAHKAARRRAATGETDSERAGHLSGNGRLYGPKAETVAFYAEALEMYRTTTKTVKEIAAATGVSCEGFKWYLHQWCKDDKKRREGRAANGIAATKYAAAIDSLRRAPRPVAEVAAEFSLNPDVFREYLKVHEPELASQQGMTRLSNGRLVKASSFEKYRDAVNDYATSADSLKSIAERHGLVYVSLLGYINRNCPEEREHHQRFVDKTSKADTD